MIDKEGMVVLLVNTESPAWVAGLKVGDIILEIDSQPVNNINDYYSAIAIPNKPKVFKVERNGEIKIFHVQIN